MIGSEMNNMISTQDKTKRERLLELTIIVLLICVYKTNLWKAL